MNDRPSSIQIAMVQHPPVFLNLAKSVRRAAGLIEEAARDGAQLIAFPETWLPGYPAWLDVAPGAGLWDHPPAKALFQLLFENSAKIPGPEVDALRAAAKQAGAYVVMGLHERDGGTLYNTTLTLDRDGERFKVHRKLVPTYTERMVWGRGDGSTLGVLQTHFGPLGGLICWEHWMPMARAAMHAQGEVVHVAQWPMVKELHQLCSRHYAFEGQCFVVAVGAPLTKGQLLEGFLSLGQPDHPSRALLEEIPGDPDDWVLRGGSAVIAPDASVLAGPFEEQTGIFHAEVDLRKIAEGHLALDTDGHYARPDVFQLHVNDRPQANVCFGPQTKP